MALTHFFFLKVKTRCYLLNVIPQEASNLASLVVSGEGAGVNISLVLWDTAESHICEEKESHSVWIEKSQYLEVLNESQKIKEK